MGTYGTEAAQARYFDELAKWAMAMGTTAAADAYVAAVKEWADEGAALAQAKYLEALANRAATSGNAADSAAYLAELAKAADRTGMPEAKQRWRDEVARFAAGAQAAKHADASTGGGPIGLPGEPLLVKHLILEYWRRRVKEHYRKRGELTSEARNIRTSLKLLRRMYGNLPAASFDQLRLERYRDSLIDERGNRVKTINTRVRQVRQMFRWGAQKKLVTSAVWADLQTLENLTEGRTRAKSGKAVPPVRDEVVAQRRSRDEQHAPVWAIPADLLEALRDVGPRLPELWESARFFSWSQKKSLLRSLIDKVVLHRLEGHKDRVRVRVVWRGGATTSTDLAVSVGRFADRGDAAQIEATILRLVREGRSDVQREVRRFCPAR